MRQKTKDGKFIIEVKDGYLEGGNYNRKDGTASIKLYAQEPSITLGELAAVIISCTFWRSELDRVINSTRFKKLKISLEIKKSEEIRITYNFEIPSYQSAEDVLLAIASNIRI